MNCIYFARHGETIWNIQNKICGATDVALTEKGHQQAKMLGRQILEQNLKIDEILCSPLIRAKDTANHISHITGIPVKEEEKLREQCFGVWEGTGKSTDFQHEKEKFCCRYNGGESMLHLAQRIYNLLDDLKDQSGQKTYMLVAHNGIARVVHSYFYDMTNTEFAEFKIKNCQILKYEFS